MYAAGQLPDHVTRYNHKYESRWMVVPAQRCRISFDRIITVIGFTMACAGLITSAVFILQAV